MTSSGNLNPHTPNTPNERDIIPYIHLLGSSLGENLANVRRLLRAYSSLSPAERWTRALTDLSLPQVDLLMAILQTSHILNIRERVVFDALSHIQNESPSPRQ